jgi:hypothetical protein
MPKPKLTSLADHDGRTLPTDRVLSVALARWPAAPLAQSVPLAIAELLELPSDLLIVQADEPLSVEKPFPMVVGTTHRELHTTFDVEAEGDEITIEVVETARRVI